MTATLGTTFPGPAIDVDRMRRATGPLIALVFIGLGISLLTSGEAKATGCEASATEIAAMLDEMARLQDAGRLG